MKRLFALIAVLVSLVAMTMPSLAIGTRGWISPPIAVVSVNAGGSYVRGPCLFTGHKTVSPCRPDLGVLPSLVSLVLPKAAHPVVALTDTIPATLVIEPSLPPPRLG